MKELQINGCFFQHELNPEWNLYFAFESGWIWADREDKPGLYMIINPQSCVVALCGIGNGEEFIALSKTISEYDNAIARGVARINCGLSKEVLGVRSL